ncbi:hypothetical protein ABW19_dt0205520 [Dactylella cylindrospora]|nr:hypothetical protein ABW19_dt0205520 [Dactylella cylindrospora]
MPWERFVAKLGVWHDFENTFACILKPASRHHEFLTGLDDILRPLSRPPQKYSIFKTESPYLGTWAYSVEIVDRELWDRLGFRDLVPWDEHCQFSGYIGGIDGSPKIFEIDRENIVRITDPIALPSIVKLLDDIVIEGQTDGDIVKPAKFKRTRMAGGTYGVERPRSVIRYESAASGLPLLSAPREPELFADEDVRNTFFNYANPGKGVVVYVLDSGCDESHPDLKNVNIQAWLSGGRVPIEKGRDTVSEYHGTAVAAKIAGLKTGVAQEAELVIAASDTRDGSGDHLAILDSLVKTYDHIRMHNSKKPCVINMSWGWSTQSMWGWHLSQGHPRASEYRDIDKVIQNMLKDIIRRLAELDVILVACAGNGNWEEKITEIPPVLKADPIVRPKMVVVGGTGVDHINRYQLDPYVTAWAPAEAILVAGPYDPEREPPCLVNPTFEQKCGDGLPDMVPGTDETKQKYTPDSWYRYESGTSYGRSKLLQNLKTLFAFN